jgi:hypothetical protein
MIGDFPVLFYRFLLRLYPRSYRFSYSAEMVDVFRQLLADSAGQGGFAFLRVILRELRDLPLSAAREQLHQLVGRNTTGSASFDSQHMSRREVFATLAAFTIPLVLMTIGSIESLSTTLPAVLIIIGLTVIAGLVRGIPRWSLPYLGLALSFISFQVVFSWLASQILPTVPPWLGPGPYEHSTRLLWQGLLTSMMWFSLFIVALSMWFALKLSRLIRLFRWPTIQGDWTQFSFIVYAGTMTALVLLTKDYHKQESIVLAGSLCLAGGAWFYLRSSHPRQRLLALLTGVTLSLGVAAVGMWLEVPLQPWMWEGLWNTAETERWFEACRAGLVWLWLVIFLLAPAATRRVRQAGKYYERGDGNGSVLC